MSLENGIKYGKEHRKQYINSKLFDYSCRNHGSCSWCKSNRLHKVNKKIEGTDQKLREYYCEEEMESEEF